MFQNCKSQVFCLIPKSTRILKVLVVQDVSPPQSCKSNGRSVLFLFNSFYEHEEGQDEPVLVGINNN